MENQTNNFQDRPRFLQTYGEVLANGAVIELVTSPSGDSITLLHWDGQNYKIGLQVENGSTILLRLARKSGKTIEWLLTGKN